MSEWAKKIHANVLNEEVKLADVLDGMDHYFMVFAKLRRIDPEAYKYFSKIGVPLITRAHKIRVRDVESERIPTPSKLPALFGGFFGETADEYRDIIINDKPSFADFEYFTKINGNIRTAAPLGTVIYRHNFVNLGHKKGLFTKAEMKKYPCVRDPWGATWLLGILPDGSIRALPMHWQTRQILPSGHSVHHSCLQIPPGLYDMKKNRDPHETVRGFFNSVRALVSAAISGTDVSIRKDGISIRLGVPIAAVKEFFADRENRSKILHYVAPHNRIRADGRVIPVGDHLRGNREFEWRGYRVIINVAGIHVPSVEGMNAPLQEWDEGDPLPDDAISLKKVGEFVKEKLWQGQRVPIRRGQPTKTYAEAKWGLVDPSA